MIIQKGTTTIILPKRVDDWFLIPIDFRSLLIPRDYLACLRSMILKSEYVKERSLFISKELRQVCQAKGMWYEVLDALEKGIG